MNAPTSLHADWIDFLERLIETEIRFLVTTDFDRRVPDLDLWVDAEIENAETISQLISDFTLGSISVSGESIACPSFEAIVMGGPPVRMNIFTFFDGRSFSEAMETSETWQIGELSISRPQQSPALTNPSTSA